MVVIPRCMPDAGDRQLLSPSVFASPHRNKQTSPPSSTHPLICTSAVYPTPSILYRPSIAHLIVIETVLCRSGNGSRAKRAFCGERFKKARRRDEATKIHKKYHFLTPARVSVSQCSLDTYWRLVGLGRGRVSFGCFPCIQSREKSGHN